MTLGGLAATAGTLLNLKHAHDNGLEIQPRHIVSPLLLGALTGAKAQEWANLSHQNKNKEKK